jgi:uncharacterized protein (DUF362 family)
MKRGSSKVALIKGNDRKKNILRALNLIKNDIVRKAKGKTILIKPNFVVVKKQKAATHVKAAEAVIEFFQRQGFKDIIIAESSAGNTMKAFENYGYFPLKKKYNIELIDLNKEPSRNINVGNVVPVAKRLLDKNNFIVSLAIPKTHNAVIATLSLKNILMGCVTHGLILNTKMRMHRAKEGINKAIARLASFVYPDLAVLDGFKSMEGNGPCDGDILNTKFAIASLDALAADRVCLECMSIPSNYLRYLGYIYKKGLGEYNLTNIGIVGNKIKDCQKKFKFHDGYKKQLCYI